MGIRVCTACMLLTAVGCGSSATPTVDRQLTQPHGGSPPGKTGDSQMLTDPKGRFSVTFPVVPAPLPPPSGGGSDSPVQLAIWEARDGDTKYILSVIYASAEFFDAKFDLNELASGGTNNPYWRVVNRKTVTTDGQPGRQVEYAATDELRSSVSVFTRYKGTVVTMSVNGLAGLTGESEGAKAYFASFRFTR